MEVREIEQIVTKKEIEEILSKSELPHIPITYYGNDGFFIPVGDIDNKQFFSGIPVTMCNKDCCIVYPHEILYIAIEDRKSVLYLIGGKIETNRHIDHWKKLLNENYFAQPHYSYIVNLNYVTEVTKDFVKIKYAHKEYIVYTSSRKIGAFKKAFLELK